MKTNSLTRLAFGTLLSLTTALVTWQGVLAYQVYAYWSTNSATYSFHSSLPTSFQSGVDFGASAWTSVSTSSWVWTRTSTSSNLIRYANIDGAGGYIAYTTVPLNGFGKISIMEIKFDSSESWYTGTGTPLWWQWDVRSAAVHEFGHALSLCHPDDPASACAGSTSACAYTTSDPSMCNFGDGDTHARTLENDDKNAITFMYP